MSVLEREGTARPKRDGFKLSRHRALGYCWHDLFGKPLHTLAKNLPPLQQRLHQIDIAVAAEHVAIG